MSTHSALSGRTVEADIEHTFRMQKAHALTLRTSTAEQRIATLERLRDAVAAHEDEVVAACHADFRKPETEARLAELMPIYSEIKLAVANVKQWMKPEKVRPTMTMLGTSAEIRREPKGTALIVAPWNYPFQLSIGPLVSAIAAGNTAIIKPSEMTPHVSAVVAKLIRNTFAPEEVAVFEGDHHVATSLLALPFDHIFFTGSPAVGRIVMAAAAKHLASVTLELGGKSPVIIDETAKLGKVVRHVMWGKLTNNGQTCIAPDYLYVHESQLEPFIEKARQALHKAFGKTIEDIKQSPDYCRIVNQRHFDRVLALLEDAQSKGARTPVGGEHDAAEQFVAPTLLTDVPPTAQIMEEEIFGPLLPVLSYTDLDRVIEEINHRPKPLALYVCSQNQDTVDRVLRQTSAGGVCVNHTLLHYAHDKLPFGGVNNSGIGKAHGHFGFEAFSNQKPVLTDKHSAMHMFYPPYTPRVSKMLGLMLRWLN